MIKTRKQFIATLLALGTLTAGASMAWDGKRSGAETRLKARLTGPAIAALKPSGEAEFRSSVGRSRLSVEVEDVNLPAGTPLTVWSQRGTGAPAMIGTITLGPPPLRTGELELNTQDGQTVPALQAGDVITIRNDTSAILSGTL